MGGKVFDMFRPLFVKFFGTYYTVKEVGVRDIYVGTIFRILQVMVVAYIGV